MVASLIEPTWLKFASEVLKMVETIISDGLIRHVHDRNIDLYVTKLSFDNPFKEPILACTKDVRQTWSFQRFNGRGRDSNRWKGHEKASLLDTPVEKLDLICPRFYIGELFQSYPTPLLVHSACNL